ncbi:MAG TPA: outer membrane lipoprotein carrier protein LolA [Terriglobia bacterium]|nr:outer membrane lipoprotein carrier protein LolA [Terriglobia bacterium]
MERALLRGMSMSGFKSKGVCILLSCFLLGVTALPVFSRGRNERLSLDQVLTHMDQTAKHLKTLSADLEYTKVTVLVNDFSTESGEMYFRNSKTPDILIKFNAPAPKVILFKKDKAEIYQPKINQVQEFDLSKHSQLIQQFLLLGFGTESKEMQKVYAVQYLKEETLHGGTTALLELTPRQGSLASQLSKVQLWISEESWLPVQQKFFEAGGDYSVARYSSVKINRNLPSSTFQLKVAKDAKRIKR